MKKVNHAGKRLAYEWADKQRSRRKKKLLWSWVEYEEGKLEAVPLTWRQVEFKTNHTMTRLRNRALKK